MRQYSAFYLQRLAEREARRSGQTEQIAAVPAEEDDTASDSTSSSSSTTSSTSSVTGTVFGVEPGGDGPVIELEGSTEVTTSTGTTTETESTTTTIITTSDGETRSTTVTTTVHGETAPSTTPVEQPPVVEEPTPEVPGLILEGDAGRDRLVGGEGNDVINGGGGRDRLNGNGGDDTIDGGSGRDFLNGGDGDDVLSGGTGNDRLIGGAGDDTFICNTGDGSDTVRDFDVNGDDVVMLNVDGINSLDDLLGTISSSRGTVTTFNFGNGDLLQLRGEELSALTEDDFIFG